VKASFSWLLLPSFDGTSCSLFSSFFFLLFPIFLLFVLHRHVASLPRFPCLTVPQTVCEIGRVWKSRWTGSGAAVTLKHQDIPQSYFGGSALVPSTKQLTLLSSVQSMGGSLEGGCQRPVQSKPFCRYTKDAGRGWLYKSWQASPCSLGP
jgi:hypothetical protein